MTYITELDHVVELNTLDGRHYWADITRDMAARGFNRTPEAWRGMWRRKHNNEFEQQRNRAIAARDDIRANRTELEERLIPILKTKRPISFITYRLKEYTLEQIMTSIENLKELGYNVHIWKEDNGFGTKEYYQIFETSTAMGSEEYLNSMTNGIEFKIAIVGDTHLGSIYEDLDSLSKFYEYAYEQGVRDFYHTGDMTDGYYKNRDTSIFEQHKIGFQQQVDYAAELYPEMEGVTTYFITGNHDVTHQRNGGADLGKVLSALRPDMVYLGHNFAKAWLSDKVDLNLVHPTDGGAQAISWKMQKFIDAASGKKKAKIVAMGHYHKMNWMFYKGTHGFVCPSFQKQTSFMSDNNLASYVGGFILTIKLDENGELLSVTPEFVDYTE